MSKIALTGNALGSGTLTLAAPNTNTDRTLTLPDESGELFLNANGAIDVDPSAPADSVAIDSSGNVGIGTSSPIVGYKLTLTEKMYISSNADVTPDASWSGQLTIGGNGYSGGLALDTSGIWLGTNSTTRSVIFATNETERARIDGNGNLLRGGTSTAFGLLSSQGLTTAGWAIGAQTSGAGAALYGGWSGSTQVFFVYGNGASYNATGTWGNSSDIKLKENIVDATPKLDSLMKVRVVNYNLKEGPQHKQIGVVAQELEQIFPGLVDTIDDKDEEGKSLGTTTKYVKYSVFVPMLIKAMQEQQALITAQQTAIEALEARVAALEGN